MKKMTLLLHLAVLIATSASAQQFWIVGGSNANEGQFPWIGDMRVDNAHHCGSSLIAPQWVLTAGHCAYTQQNQTTPMDTNQMVFRFNTVSTNGNINPNGGVQRKVKKIFVHPSFDMNNLGNGYDLSLYQLSEPVTTITPISLPDATETSSLYQISSFVNIAGWGIADTALVVTQPDTMKFGRSRIQVCQGTPDRIFCIGYNNGDSVQYQVGSAAGDSGGPSWVENGSVKKITGVVSGGSGPTTTAGQPGIFTKIATFRPWIDSIMSNSGSTSLKPVTWNDEDIKIGIDQQSAIIYFGFLGAGSVVCNIYNVDGKKVYQAAVASPSLTTHTIPMGALPAGMYVVHIYNPQKAQQFSKKIVKAY